jgi:hypothetical protein
VVGVVLEKADSRKEKVRGWAMQKARYTNTARGVVHYPAATPSSIPTQTRPALCGSSSGP